MIVNVDLEVDDWVDPQGVIDYLCNLLEGVDWFHGITEGDDIFERQSAIDADLVSRAEVKQSLVSEYNRRHTKDGLKLAWIEKAVNDVPNYGKERVD